METELNQSKKLSTPVIQTRLSPHLVSLISMWLFTCAVMVWMLANGVRDNGEYRFERIVLQVIYVAVVFWYLSQTGPSLARLPEVQPILLRGSVVGRWIPVILIAFLFYDVDSTALDLNLAWRSYGKNYGSSRISKKSYRAAR